MICALEQQQTLRHSSGVFIIVFGSKHHKLISRFSSFPCGVTQIVNESLNRFHYHHSQHLHPIGKSRCIKRNATPALHLVYRFPMQLRENDKWPATKALEQPHVGPPDTRGGCWSVKWTWALRKHLQWVLYSSWIAQRIKTKFSAVYVPQIKPISCCILVCRAQGGWAMLVGTEWIRVLCPIRSRTEKWIIRFSMEEAIRSYWWKCAERNERKIKEEEGGGAEEGWKEHYWRRWQTEWYICKQELQIDTRLHRLSAFGSIVCFVIWTKNNGLFLIELIGIQVALIR